MAIWYSIPFLYAFHIEVISISEYADSYFKKEYLNYSNWEDLIEEDMLMLDNFIFDMFLEDINEIENIEKKFNL